MRWRLRQVRAGGCLVPLPFPTQCAWSQHDPTVVRWFPWPSVVAEEPVDIDKGFEDFSGEGYTQVRCCAWQVSWGCVSKRSLLSRVLSAAPPADIHRHAATQHPCGIVQSTSAVPVRQLVLRGRGGLWGGRASSWGRSRCVACPSEAAGWGLCSVHARVFMCCRLCKCMRMCTWIARSLLVPSVEGFPRPCVSIVRVCCCVGRCAAAGQLGVHLRRLRRALVVPVF
jgi:hypothetical protein